MRSRLSVVFILAAITACGGGGTSTDEMHAAAWCCEGTGAECMADAKPVTVCVDGECHEAADYSCWNVRCGLATEETLACVRGVSEFCAWRGAFDAARGCRPADHYAIGSSLVRQDACLPEDAGCI